MDASRALFGDKNHTPRGTRPPSLAQDPRAMSGGYFTTDRARKYGWGVPRLALLTLFAFEVVPRYFLDCLLYTSPSPRDKRQSRMPSSA